MRKLSYWGKYNPVKARMIIISARILLLYIAWFLGSQLAMAEMASSPLWLYGLVLLFFAGCAFYPTQTTAWTYTRRKWCDLVVCLAGFLMAICITIQLQLPLSLYQHVQAAVPVENNAFRSPEAQILLEQFQRGEKTKFNRKEKRIIRKEFTYQLLQYGKATVTQNKEQQANALLILLACIAAVGLLYLVLALACTLSCNGSDAAALVVGLLGTAAVIWGLVAVIRSISRSKRAPQSQAPATEPEMQEKPPF